jgi:hypothetical protein
LKHTELTCSPKRTESGDDSVESSEFEAEPELLPPKRKQKLTKGRLRKLNARVDSYHGDAPDDDTNFELASVAGTSNLGGGSVVGVSSGKRRK